jgi:PmbA protein
LAPPSPPPLPPPGHDAPVAAADLCDGELAGMTAPRVREIFQGLAAKGETIRLGWTEGRIAVASSRGLRRAAEVTSGWLEVIRGRHPGAGRAAAASRSLAGLNPQEVVQRARRRQGPSQVTRPPAHAVPLLLSQEATAGLIELLSRYAFVSDSFHSGASFLRDRLGQPVFHPTVHLRDDPTDPRGLPFPFDLLGAAAQPIDLVADGVALTPAADNRLARELGIPPTPQRVAPDEAVPGHLFLLPGNATEDELLQAAEGGVWVAALDPVEIYDPRALRFRAVARGVRGIAGGQLARSLPDLIWEDDLQSVLFRVLAIGSDLVSIATGAGLFRASTAPMLAVAAVHGLHFVVD